MKGIDLAFATVVVQH